MFSHGVELKSCIRTTVALLVFVSCHVASAQEKPIPLWLGVNAGYGITLHILSGAQCLTGCPEYSGGVGGAPFAGVSLDWFATDRFGASLRAQYLLSSITMQTTSASVNVLNQNGDSVPLVRSYAETARLPELITDLSAFYAIGKWKLSVGASVGIVMSPEWESSVQILDPANQVYGNGKTDTIFFPRQSLPNINTLQVRISGGVNYDIPLSAKVSFVPELRVFLPVTKLRDIDSWKESIVELGASLKFGFGGHEEVPPVVPPPPPPPPALHRDSTIAQPIREIPIEAKLAVYGINENGVRSELKDVHVQVQFVTQAFPLLPLVFFDSQSSTLPERYTKQSTTGDLSINPNPLALNRNMLNIVGQRMTDHPLATIKIHGAADTTTENGDCLLARSRAQSVQSYLETAWHIDSHRIEIATGDKACAPDFPTITKTEEGFAENRRVTIESDDHAILEPVARTQYLEPVVIDPRHVECDPAGTTATGINRWSMKSASNGQLLFADSGQGNPTIQRFTFAERQIAILRENERIQSSLEIVGTNGSGVTSTQNIGVQFDTLNIAVQRLSLTLFGTSQDAVSHDDVKTIRQFLHGFDPADSVTIFGYTDKLGDTKFNEELSDRRAQNVDSVVHSIAPNATHVNSAGMGYRRLPPGVYSYETPEERFLARTVQIEVRSRRK